MEGTEIAVNRTGQMAYNSKKYNGTPQLVDLSSNDADIDALLRDIFERKDPRFVVQSRGDLTEFIFSLNSLPPLEPSARADFILSQLLIAAGWDRPVRGAAGPQAAATLSSTERRLGTIRDENVKHMTLMAGEGIKAPADFVNAINSLLEIEKAISITVLALDQDELDRLKAKIGLGEFDRLSELGVEVSLIGQDGISAIKDARVKAIDTEDYYIFSGVIQVFSVTDKELIEAIGSGV